MENKTEKRKAAFVKASSATLAEFEKDIFFDSESGKHEGDLLAAKIATGLLGLMAIDVIESYESLAESGLPESVREAKLLTDIFDAALFTAIDVFASTLRFVGKQGESLYSAAVDVLSEKLSEIEEADRPDWDDVPQEVLEHIASEAGVTIEQLKEGYSFRAVNLMDGTPVYDIKPYVPYADSRPEASGGFTDSFRRQALEVDFPSPLLERFPEGKREALLGVLAQDPRPAYQDDPERVYGLTFGGFNLRFTVWEGKLRVLEVKQNNE